jgi:hypothetical protein
LKFRPFADARQLVHWLKLSSSGEWKQYCKSGRKPKDIPYDPSKVYKNEWKSWGDWLGTGYIALRKKEYRPFEEAKQFVHSLHLKNERNGDITSNLVTNL